MTGLAGGVLLPLTVGTLTGCATGGGGKGGGAPGNVPVPPADGKAVLYFYRTSSMIGAGRGYTIFLNDRPVGNLDSGSWRRAEVDPGRYALKAEFTTAAWSGPTVRGLDLEVQVGQVRFIRLAIGIHVPGAAPSGAPMIWSSSNQLMEMDPRIALQHLANLDAAE